MTRGGAVKAHAAVKESELDMKAKELETALAEQRAAAQVLM